MAEHVIHIYWQGPFLLDDLKKFNNESTDYGIYQIYGPHPSYGKNTLLYIGQACQRTFKTRIKEHDWGSWQDYEGSVSFYLGRLCGLETPTTAQWDKQIDLAEKLLISIHKPAYNSSGIGELSKKTYRKLQNIHILNWGNYSDLLPEVSGSRWTDKYIGEFETYKLK